jgi:hypothetical protein
MWHNGTTYQRDDGTLVESGIHSTSRFICDAVEPPIGGDPSTGDGGAPPPLPGPPSPPGSLLPKPPASAPPSVAPPCVDGANNSRDPGRGEGGQTGNGQTLLDNLTPLLASGDVKIDSTSPSRIVTIDVNLGPSANGAAGINPFEGMTPEEANRAMYWPGAFDPGFVEIGPRGRVISAAVRYAYRAAYGSPAARQSFHLIMRNASAALRTEIFNELEVAMQTTIANYGSKIPPEVKVLLNELAELVFEVIETGPIERAVSPSSDYIEAASSGDALGNGSTGGSRGYGENKGVCGQIAASTAGSVASLLPAAPTGRITLTGTASGTLIERVKALAKADVFCAPVRATVTAGQSTSVDVASGCIGARSRLHVLDRFEVSRLSSEQQNGLLRSADQDLVAGAIFQFDLSPVDHGGTWPDRNATAVFANGRVGFVDDGADGRMTFSAPPIAGGLNDYVVVAATDASGAEHPFLVTVAIASQPVCSTADGPAGPDSGGFRAVVQGGGLQLLRDQPFVLSPRMFCTADPRHTYRVTVEGTISGTRSELIGDGTVRFDWTDPDIIGSASSLTITAWDEVTGVPSPPVSIPVMVRDVAPVCNDVEIDYDRSELDGGPLDVPVDCGMAGGLSVLKAPFLGLAGYNGDPTALTVDGGEFTSDGLTLHFTPNESGVELSTARVVPSTIDPRVYSPYRVRGPAFFIDVRLHD